MFLRKKMKKFKIKRVKLDITSSFGAFLMIYNYTKDKKLGRYNKRNQKEINYLKNLDIRCPLCNNSLLLKSRAKTKAYVDYNKSYIANLHNMSFICSNNHWRFIIDSSYSEISVGYNSVFFTKGNMQYMGFFFKKSGESILYYGEKNNKHVLPTSYIKGLKSIDYKNIEKLLILK